MPCIVYENILNITMKIISLRTERLELIPITEELCNADLVSPHLLGEKLNAIIPDTWPPALLTPETLQEFIALLTAPEDSRLIAYYWISTEGGNGYRTLIGSGGFVISEDGIPELGYSVLDEFQCRGYATEAARMMITWIQDELSPASIHACTYPSLTGSIRVLEKTGFVYTGPGIEEGTIEYRFVQKDCSKHEN